jgi:putative oxidoreductase
MDVLVLIGRILFAALFLNSAIGHLTQSKAMAGYAGSKGVPAPRAVVFASGILLAAGSLSVLLGIWADLGALLMHNFWTLSNAEARQDDMIHFLKDVALSGACLMLLAFFSFVGDDLGLTITGPLFDIS